MTPEPATAGAPPTPEPTPRQRAETRRLHIHIFSSASDAPRARRPTDAVLFAVSFVGILLSLLRAPEPTQLDRAIENLVRNAPGLFGGVWEVAYDLLVVWPLILLAITLFAHRRKRVFGEMVLALVVSLAYTALAASEIGSDVSAAVSTSDRYLGVRLAAATALIATVSPHLSHPLRLVGRWILLLGAAATIALAAAVPVGTFIGFLIGLAGAATIHLLVGSPGGRMTLDDVDRALREMGVEVMNLRDEALDPRGVSIVRAESAAGRPVVVKIFGRDARQGQLISSAWSSLRRRGETVRLGSGMEQVQHEGFVSLLAERGGVPVMPVIAAGAAAEGDALLVLDADARDLSSMEPDVVDDDLLDQFWAAFRRLQDLGIALGRVDGRGLAVRLEGSAAIASFSDAMLAAYRPAILADQAQLLVSTALVVGQERAVAAAVRVLGNEGTEAFLPYVQPAALDPTTWREVKGRGWELEDLRVRAEQATGSAPAELEELRRVTWGSILKLVLIGLVAYALLSAILDIGIENLVDAFKAASKAWLVGALVLSPLSQVPQAFSTLGATLKRLRFFPVLMLQYGIQFIALAVPSSAARVALEIRFFERVGIPAAGALTIGMIDSFSTFCIQILLIIIITVSGMASLHLFDGSGSDSPAFDRQAITLLVGLLSLALLAALIVPRFRAMLKRFIAGLRQKAADGREALQVLRYPNKLLYLLGGNLVAQMLLAIILGMCMRAFGYSASLAELLLINTVVSLFAGFMPVPGGVGVAEAAYTACLVAAGLPVDAATSIAIAYRTVTFYVPPAWGSWAMHWMKEHRYL
jgi:uncharacterized membrane protein YbhN (UPF0104 family)